MGSRFFGDGVNGEAAHTLSLGAGSNTDPPHAATEDFIRVGGVEVGADKAEDFTIADNNSAPGLGVVQAGIGVLLGDGSFKLFLAGAQLQRVCLQCGVCGEFLKCEACHVVSVWRLSEHQASIFM